VSRRTSTPPVLRRPARGAAALILGVATAVLTACGGSNSGTDSAATTASATSSSAAATGSASGGSGAAAAQSLTATEADFSITLDKSTLTPGAYTIQVVNNGNATHDLAVEQNGNKLAGSDKIGPGQSTTLEVTLEPGTYVFYCSIGNHRAMGMEQTVTVQ
jgi:plastocyanin